MGYNEQTALVPYKPQRQDDNVSVLSLNSTRSKLGNPKAIEYLKIGSDERENIRDYILNTRDILKSQIMINDFNDEMERLKEYIIMAQEKLEVEKNETQMILQEFKQNEMDDKTEADRINKELRNQRNTKKALVAQIEQLNNDILKVETRIKKHDDDLVEYKQHKHFLDVVAIQAKRKTARPSNTA